MKHIKQAEKPDIFGSVFPTKKDNLRQIFVKILYLSALLGTVIATVTVTGTVTAADMGMARGMPTHAPELRLTGGPTWNRRNERTARK